MTFEEQHSVYLVRCEEALSAITRKLFIPTSKVSEAALYSLLNGGKRVRGILVLAVANLLSGDSQTADVFAAAIEMVHSFSLVHDDLPCMDNDDLRRGKPSNHVVYGEANALLAGDLLLVEAFEAIAASTLADSSKLEGISLLAARTGARGMIYGQELDLFYENSKADEAALVAIHRNKTGALLSAAAGLGIIAAGLAAENCTAILEYAEKIGMVFQIVDDILDATSTAENLGKPVGSDPRKQKTTFVSVKGLDASRREVEILTRQAVRALEQQYGNKSAFLCEYAEKLAARVR